MPRPLSIAERKRILYALKHGNTVLEISKQLPFISLSEIKAFVDSITDEIKPVRMSVSLAYFEFPSDPPERLAKRLGYKTSEVKAILKAKGLPWRETK